MCGGDAIKGVPMATRPRYGGLKGQPGDVRQSAFARWHLTRLRRDNFHTRVPRTRV